MYKTREDFIKALGVSQMPDAFGLRYEESMAEYDKVGAPFLSEEYIEELQKDFDIFTPEYYDFVQSSAKRIRENDFLARYSLLLYHMQLDKPPMKQVSLKEIPEAPEEPLRTDYEMAVFFSQLANARQMAEYHRSREVPENIIIDTLRDCYEGAIRVHVECFERYGYEIERCFAWNQFHTNHKLLRIGVLNFEFKYSFVNSYTKVYKSKSGEYKVLIDGSDISPEGHIVGTAGQNEVAYHAAITETDDYIEGYAADHSVARIDPTPVRLDKKEWSLIIDQDVQAVGVHIPSGVEFTPENTEWAYKECVRVLKKHFPEFKPKVFTCFSWLMDPQLRGMLKPTSKILAFQSRYKVKFPIKNGWDAPYGFLFKKPVDKMEDLSEDTSLQRTVKQHYLAGKYIYAPCGLLFDYFDD